jgi:hypothetical protein
MYNAIIAKIFTRPLEGADNIQIGNVCGYDVIVGKDVENGSLGIFFEEGGQLSPSYLAANDLVTRKNLTTGAREGGFFNENGRVRAIKLRGVKSEGYFAPLSSLTYLNGGGFYTSILKEGDTFTSINGTEVCRRYETPATRRAAQGQPKTSKKNKFFAEHVDTTQFRFGKDNIPVGSIIHITEKLHGTSGRFGYVLEEQEFKLPRGLGWLCKVAKLFGTEIPTVHDFTHLLGTRRVILKEATRQTSYYGGDQFRTATIKDIEGRLFKGEIIYYELVGYTETGAAIMSGVDLTKLKDKSLVAQYGKTMNYSYGCDPDKTGLFQDHYEAMLEEQDEKPSCALYVYRITRVTDDGHVTELSWPQVKARCEQLGLKTVPDIDGPIVYTHTFGLEGHISGLVEGSSTLDPRHIKEGVVLRIDTPDGRTYFLKHKSFTFRLAEGMVKEDPNAVDMEEAA